MRFIFNLLVLAFFIFLAYIGYNVIVEEKTIAETLDGINDTTEQGKVELAQALVERELNRRLKNNEFDSFNRVKCFSDSIYGTSCKIHNLTISNKIPDAKFDHIDINLYIYNAFSVLKLIEARSGFFNLDTKLKAEINSPDISELISESSGNSLEIRRIEEELKPILYDNSYIELSIKTKKDNYNEVLSDIGLTTGAKASSSTITISTKLGEPVVDAIEKVLNKKDANINRVEVLENIYPREAKLSADIPNDVLPKLLYTGINDSSKDYNTWREEFNNERETLASELRSELRQFNIESYLIDDFISFIYGERRNFSLSLSVRDENLNLRSILAREALSNNISIK